MSAKAKQEAALAIVDGTRNIRRYVASNEEIYDLILKYIGDNDNHPMSATMLHQIGEIQEACMRRWGVKDERSVAKISDLLGFLWRKGLLVRHWNNEAGSKTRYAYNIKLNYLPSKKAEPKPPPNPKIAEVKVNEGTQIEEIGDELHIRGKYFHITIKRTNRKEEEKGV